VPARRIACGVVALGLTVSLGACSGSDSRPPATTSGAGGGSDSSGGGSTSGPGSSAGGAGGEAGASPSEATTGENSTGGSGGTAGGSSGGSGGTGGAGEGVCGDGVVDADEDCEPDVSSASSCVGFGYEEGEVACTDDCRYDFSDCSGVERCFDATDNDGDGDEDCDDDDCSDACASSCDEIPELADPAFVTLDNTGHASELDLSCGAGADAGPELVYRVEVATTGMLDATVDAGGFPEISVSIRTSCEDDDSEVACAGTRASAPVSEGDVVYVTVQGTSEADVGDFRLSVQSRPLNVCGDGFWDEAEACDDANLDSGDGCSDACSVELTESEPNQDAGEANAYEAPFYGEISPQGDIDVVAIEVVDDGSYVIANTFTLVSGGCTFESFDPFLQLLDVDGTTPLAENDDDDGTCSRIVFEGLDIGTYYLAVRESSNSVGVRSEFPYRLGVTIDSCGNGSRGPLEECDDGNTDDSDGCSSSCQTE